MFTARHAYASSSGDTVKLSNRRDEFQSLERNGHGSGKKCRGLRVLRYIGDLVPEKKRLSTDVPVLLGRQAISLATEDVLWSWLHPIPATRPTRFTLVEPDLRNKAKCHDTSLGKR